jgi:hypothetical protein
MKKLFQTILIVSSLSFLSASAQNSPASEAAKEASAAAKEAASDSLPDKSASKATILAAITALTQKNPVFAVEIVSAAFEKYGSIFNASFTTADIIGAAKSGVNKATVANVNAPGTITTESKGIVLQSLDATVGANGIAVAYNILVNNRTPLVVNPSASTLPTVVFQKLITDTNPQ